MCILFTVFKVLMNTVIGPQIKRFLYTQTTRRIMGDLQNQQQNSQNIKLRQVMGYGEI